MKRRLSIIINDIIVMYYIGLCDHCIGAGEWWVVVDGGDGACGPCGDW